MSAGGHNDGPAVAETDIPQLVESSDRRAEPPASAASDGSPTSSSTVTDSPANPPYPEEYIVEKNRDQEQQEQKDWR